MEFNSVISSRDLMTWDKTMDAVLDSPLFPKETPYFVVAMKLARKDRGPIDWKYLFDNLVGIVLSTDTRVDRTIEEIYLDEMLYGLSFTDNQNGRSITEIDLMRNLGENPLPLSLLTQDRENKCIFPRLISKREYLKNEESEIEVLEGYVITYTLKTPFSSFKGFFPMYNPQSTIITISKFGYDPSITFHSFGNREVQELHVICENSDIHVPKEFELEIDGIKKIFPVSSVEMRTFQNFDGVVCTAYNLRIVELNRKKAVTYPSRIAKSEECCIPVVNLASTNHKLTVVYEKINQDKPCRVQVRTNGINMWIFNTHGKKAIFLRE